MKLRPGRKKELDAFIDSVKVSQKNVLWPDVLRGGRSVDELLWKGSRNAPIVQRVGVVVLALAYLMMALVFTSGAFESGDWPMGVVAALLFGAGGWFIRNALRK